MGGTNNIVAAVMLLQKAPRTQKEMAGLLGVSRAAVSRYFSALGDEGLIAIRQAEGPDGRRVNYYEWIKT